MSYIRCGSNPENLYVWGDVSGDVFFSMGAELKSMPKEVFDGLMHGFIKEDYPEEFEFQGASIRELLGYGYYFPEKSKENPLGAFHPDFGKIQIAYKDWSIRLWPVTFFYIIHGIEERLRYETLRDGDNDDILDVEDADQSIA